MRTQPRRARRASFGVLMAGLMVCGAVTWLAVASPSGPSDSAASRSQLRGVDGQPAIDVGAAADGGDIAQAAADDRVEVRSSFSDRSLAEASLQALKANGALPENGLLDGGPALIGLVHYVDCLEGGCDLIIEWAQSVGLAVSSPIVTLGHGGVEELHVEIRDFPSADPAAMTDSADRIVDAVDRLADRGALDMRYDGWAPESVTGGDR